MNAECRKRDTHFFMRPPSNNKEERKRDTHFFIKTPNRFGGGEKRVNAGFISDHRKELCVYKFVRNSQKAVFKSKGCF
jgi:hypothetical protein